MLGVLCVASVLLHVVFGTCPIDCKTTCNAGCMNRECRWEGLSICEALFVEAKTCDDKKQCKLEMLFDYNGQADCMVEECYYDGRLGYGQDAAACGYCVLDERGVNPFRDDCLSVECFECSPSLTRFVCKQPRQELRTKAYNPQVPVSVMDSANSNVEYIVTGGCLLGQSRAQDQLVCSDPWCKGIFYKECSAVNEGKGYLEDFCAPGCKLSMLNNGVCDFACSDVACNYDEKDCKVPPCNEAKLKIRLPQTVGQRMTCRDLYNRTFNQEIVKDSTEWCFDVFFEANPNVIGSTDLRMIFKIDLDSTRFKVSWGHDNLRDCKEAFENEMQDTFALDQCYSSTIANHPDLWDNTNGNYFYYSFDLDEEINYGGCQWEQIGDGICNELCYTKGCLYDLGDCEQEEKCECDLTYPGDGYCDGPPCYSEACGWDLGDCWCVPECPHWMLYNDVCDEACNNAACYHDFGQCDCSVGCHFHLLGNGVCDLDCDNPQCNQDDGDCIKIPDLYDDPSWYKVVIYNQVFENDDCPEIKKIEAVDDKYDQDELENEGEEEQPNKDLKPGWESSGEKKFFGPCYSSFRHGYFKATLSKGEDGERGEEAEFFFNCADATCDPEFCLSVKLKSGECDSSTDVSILMTWEVVDSGNGLSVSLLVLFLFGLCKIL